VFAEKNREKTMFYPVYLGETSPFNAGAQLLQKQGIDTSKIDTEKKLIAELQRFYQSCTGILILDDVRSADVETLLPEVDGWNVLVTTRDKTLARKLCGDTNVRELDVLSGDDAIQLMRNVLQGGFSESQSEVYGKLCEHLAYRPYSIRLAAGYLLNALDPSPLKLLERLKLGKAIAVDEDLGFNRITILLEDCLDQLEKKSLLAVKLVKALSVGADQGMPLDRFVQWQQSVNGYDETSIESALIAGRDSGIILVEKENSDGQERVKLRLHADLLRVLWKKESRETVDSLITYLDDLLVKRKYLPTLDRLMYVQVFSLIERYREDATVTRTLYETFWMPLWSTGELKQAFKLGELSMRYTEIDGDKCDLQMIYGNQALVLADWGKYIEAMELHKKEETICIELGEKNSLQRSLGNQALILWGWGQLEGAMDLLKKQEAICLELGNRDSLQRCYGNQGLILNTWGKLVEAMELHKKEEMICIELGERNNLQRSIGNQALILWNWGKLEEAMDLLKKQEAICLELGNRDSLQRSYGNQVLILLSWGKLEEAMKLHKKQETICLELGNKNDLQRIYGNQALILKAWDRLEEAMELNKKQETICLELGNWDSLQRSYGNRALILYDWGRLEEAMELCKKQEKICIEVGLKPSLKICYQNQIDLYNKMKKKKEAKEVRKKLKVLEWEMDGK
jgi:tetratricopeptide (TPR) repeat protein